MCKTQPYDAEAAATYYSAHPNPALPIDTIHDVAMPTLPSGKHRPNARKQTQDSGNGGGSSSGGAPAAATAADGSSCTGAAAGESGVAGVEPGAQQEGELEGGEGVDAGSGSVASSAGRSKRLSRKERMQKNGWEPGFRCKNV